VRRLDPGLKSGDLRPFTPRRVGMQPIDWIVGAYFALTSLLLVFLGGRIAWEIPVAVRLIFFGILLFLRRSPVPRNRFWWLLRMSYPIFFYPYFYQEIGELNGIISSDRFDETVIAWEQAIFQCMPSVELRQWLSWKPLSEYLHLAYISYLLLAPFTIIVLFLKRKADAVCETVTTVTLTFITCYMIFIPFPVLGPFHVLSRPDPAEWGWFFPQLTHAIVERGSSMGTAFPSSHVAVAVSLLMQAARHDRALFRILLAIVPALVVGVVYGGFHYAIDAIAGLAIAISAGLIGPMLWRRLEEAREEVADRRRWRRRWLRRR